MRLNEGTIYIVEEEDTAIPKFSHVEFIGGPDEDMFSNGSQVEYYIADNLSRCPSQKPIEYTEEMQRIKAAALSGIDLN